MKDLAERDREVSILLELGIHGRDAGSILLSDRLIADESISCRSYAGHQAGTRSAAGRNHAVGTFKQNTGCSQPVNVWRMNVLLAVAGEFWPQIINSDEQNIGTISSLAQP